jgi:hypothetical protein
MRAAESLRAALRCYFEERVQENIIYAMGSSVSIPRGSRNWRIN